LITVSCRIQKLINFSKIYIIFFQGTNEFSPTKILGTNKIDLGSVIVWPVKIQYNKIKFILGVRRNY
jgi:hypothetical protein